MHTFNPRKDESLRKEQPEERPGDSDSDPETLPTSPHSVSRNMTTERLAAELGMRAQSIRRRYCLTGSYFSLRPVKLPNRRLLWPADALEQLAHRK